MGKFNGTKGEWESVPQKGTKNHCFQSQVFCGNESIAVVDSTENPEESTANAKLIADAGTTMNECGLFPSELLKKYNEILETQKEQIIEAAKYTLEQCDIPRKGSLNDFFEDVYKQVTK